MKTFSTWLTTTELGNYLLALELRWFDRAAADAFGYRAVQVGLPEVNFLRANRIPQQYHTCERSGGQLRCEAAQLPFGTRTLDLLALPHVLDFTSQPHLVLREAERVLVPGGRLVLSGFNPISLWGARRLIQNRGAPPWNGNFLTLSRIKDWLTLLDLEPGVSAFMGYAPPFSQIDWIRQFRFMETAGERWWPLAAGVYGIEAVKRHRGMRLLLPAWKAASTRAGLVTAGRNDRHPLPADVHDK